MSGSVPVDLEGLRRLRQRRVMAWRELADKAGVGYSTLANLESGFSERARPEVIRKLAAAVRAKPESLVAVEKL